MLIDFSMNLVYQVILQAASFLIFVVLIGKFFYKPVNDMLIKRKEGIEKDLKTASDKAQNAIKLESEYDEKIANVSQERYEILSAAKNEATTLKEDIIIKAKEDAALIEQNAKKDAANEHKKAMANYKNDMIELSMLATQKVLKDTLDDGLQDKIVSNITKEINEANV